VIKLRPVWNTGNSPGHATNHSELLQDSHIPNRVWGSYCFESNIQHMPASLFFKPNNNWILSWGKSTLDRLVARLPLIFGENCASSFCGSMCSSNRSNTFSRYSIPNVQRTIFRSSNIQAPSTRVAYLAATSVSTASGVKLTFDENITNAI